jgi:hypothetical protein
MTKAVLSILRQTAEPLTSRDIALELLVTRALDKDDQKLLALMTKRRRSDSAATARQWRCAVGDRDRAVHGLGDRGLACPLMWCANIMWKTRR